MSENITRERLRETVEAVLDERSIDFPQLVSLVEEGGEAANEVLERVARPVPEATIVGITGPPGAGKSTLVDQLIDTFRDQDRTVGVVAVDPESDETGGAFLGDRVRLQSSARDEGVFYRSLSTPGELGRTLSQSTVDVVSLLDAWGKDVVVIETVGAGQTDTEIASIADTVVLTLYPGGGDQVQMNKSGILEIGDVFVVNKADLRGADSLVANLRNLVSRRRKFLPDDEDHWQPPILKTVALDGTNVETLVSTIEDHQEHLQATRDDPERELVERMLESKVEERVRAEVTRRLDAADGLDDVVEEILEGDCNVYAAMERTRIDPE